MSTNLAHFIGRDQIHVLNCNMRGEEGEYFKQMLVDLKARIDKMPSTGQTDGQGSAAVAYLHYFAGGQANWYITEKDIGSADQSPGEEQWQAFGLADLFGDGGELGYICIPEIINNRGEIDLYWTPKTLARIRGEECQHNEMVEITGDPAHAWKCAKCGHVYGTEDEAVAAMQEVRS